MHHHHFNTAGNANGCGAGFGHKRGHFEGSHQFGGGHFHKRPKYNVPVNIVENETEYEVHVFATGFDKSDISLSVSNDLLHINGEKKLNPEDAPNFSRQEFPIKTFERQISLNGRVEISEISATQENNVLIVRLPKSAKAKSENHRIDID